MQTSAFLQSAVLSKAGDGSLRRAMSPARRSSLHSPGCMLSQDANARTPNNSQAVSAAKRLREAHTSHTSALRDQLLSRVAESIASALTTNAAQELQSAIAEAADARARADAAVRTIASVRDSAAVVTSSIQKKFDHEHAAVSALEKRVQFLVNTIKEKDRILARSMLASAVDSAREASTESEDEGASSESTKTSGPALRKKIECAVDAEACMSSLLLYPSLSEPVTETISTSFHGARNLKERPIPEFSVALKNYLQAISPYSDRANPALALSAYTQLWRSVSAPGRKGWRGEIMSMVLAECNSDLVSSASVSPDLRRALVSDLRMLHSLHRTPASDVVAWLGENVGVSPPPLTLPEYGTVSLPLTNVLEDTPVETLNGFDKSQHADQMKKLIDLLDQAEDWGHDDVVEAVVQNFQEGSSEASTLAEHYYGLRWNANGVLQGLLSSRDVGELPEYHFVGIEGIRNRLCQNCEFLLHDLTASNVHVWGPPGSGKSSCVMSLLKQFGARGLRIIEVTKETLATLPDLFEVISKLRQKFIVFVDDLTFEEHESEQMRLAKAALEGSLRMNPTNVFVLCTSNRRFPVGSRLTDASEEKLAFSFRFGIILAFPRTTREAYLRIVHTLAKERGVVMPEDELDDLALTWALGQDGNSNSLSGRTARQFVDHVASSQALNGLGVTDYLVSAGNQNVSAVPANSLWASENAYHIQRFRALIRSESLDYPINMNLVPQKEIFVVIPTLVSTKRPALTVQVIKV